jgi:hypothetical protein
MATDSSFIGMGSGCRCVGAVSNITQDPGDTPDATMCIFFVQIVLPQSNHVPSLLLQLFHDGSITSPVPKQFFRPISGVTLRRLRVNIASVPETAIYKNREAAFRKHEVGSAWQLRPAAPSSNTIFTEESNHSHLGVFVSGGLNEAHNMRALPFTENVRHLSAI